MTKNQNFRTRNYATIVYADSAPENWKSFLFEQHIPGFISPLHNNDFNPTGEPKKPHWHVMLMFDSVKTKDQVQEIFNKINAVGCEAIQSFRGYSRYLCHLDNPEKAQYSSEHVQSLCGADYYSACSLVTDKHKAIKEMIEFCKFNDLLSYSRLIEYCISERPEWFRVLCDNGTLVIKEYLKSRSWTTERDLKRSNYPLPNY